MKILPVNNIYCINRPSFGSVKSASECYCDCFTRRTDGVDITYRANYPLNVLSNFAETDFTLDGVRIKSTEGFLQSLKINDPERQREICLMEGLRAKGIGKKLNKQRVYDGKNLYWANKCYRRNSPEYQELLKRMYEARYDADANFRQALNYTRGSMLTHNIGRTDPGETILTESEFVRILTNLRDRKCDFCSLAGSKKRFSRFI